MGTVSIRLACHPVLDNKTRVEVCWLGRGVVVLGKIFLVLKETCKNELVPLLPLDIVMRGCDNGNSWTHLAASLWMKPMHKGGRGSWKPEVLGLELPLFYL